MGSKLDKIVIIDLEATCWEPAPPPNEQSDIIEIGVCTVDVKTFKIEDKTSLIIKPTRSNISDFCTKLTTITPEMVVNGMTFKNACNILDNKFNTKNRIWGSWGEYDKNMINNHCNDFDVHNPMGRTHLNLKALFAVSAGLSKEVGLDKALQILNIPMEGTHHRGHDDAANIAKVFCHIFKRSKI